jgi:hypothetical protein
MDGKERLEAAAEEKYRGPRMYVGTTTDREVAAYIQGRLDQAEEDARIAEAYRGSDHFVTARKAIAAEIRKGVK